MKTSSLGHATEKSPGNRKWDGNRKQVQEMVTEIDMGKRKRELCKSCTGRDELKLSTTFFMKGLTVV